MFVVFCAESSLHILHVFLRSAWRFKSSL